jgi:hypothetical protein
MSLNQNIKTNDFNPLIHKILEQDRVTASESAI